MVCLSGIWWYCSWEKISWKEGKAIIVKYTLCLPHSHSTLLSRRNTNLWSWFLEHWDLLLNKLTRGELPLWWDNKGDISSLNPLWEQIEGLWVVCVHVVDGWGAMPMLEKWWLGHSSILWELRVQFFAQDFYCFLCFLGVRTDCKINCVPANLTLQSLEKLTFHIFFFFFLTMLHPFGK